MSAPILLAALAISLFTIASEPAPTCPPQILPPSAFRRLGHKPVSMHEIEGCRILSDRAVEEGRTDQLLLAGHDGRVVDCGYPGYPIEDIGL